MNKVVMKKFFFLNRVFFPPYVDYNLNKQLVVLNLTRPDTYPCSATRFKGQHAATPLALYSPLALSLPPLATYADLFKQLLSNCCRPSWVTFIGYEYGYDRHR